MIKEEFIMMLWEYKKTIDSETCVYYNIFDRILTLLTEKCVEFWQITHCQDQTDPLILLETY